MAGRERPLGRRGGPAPVREFAEGLRDLRNAAGISYQQMARQVHFSAATLNDAAQGRKLPSLEVALAFVRACGGDEQQWTARWQQVRDQLDRAEVATQEAAAPSLASRADRGRAGTRCESVRALGENDPREVGGFTLVGFLGAGAMGRVYLGRTLGGRRVAVKLIDAELGRDEEFRSRFRQEIDAARRVHGMFTAAVVAADPHAERPWLATEYVPGPSLQEAVTLNGRLPADVVIKLAAGVAEALAAVHGAGVVHRDLKPGNVLLAEDGPRVIDFGIARAQDATSLTRTNMRVGTPGYMAPEQIEAKGAVGPPCDVFALGALLAFAATGASPYGSGAATSLAFRIVHGEPDLEAVPEELRELVRRCLDKDPSARPTPQEVVDWCRQRAGLPGAGWLPGPLTELIRQRAREAAAAKPPKPKAERAARQHRGVLASAVAMVTVVAAMLGLLGWRGAAGMPNLGSLPSITAGPGGDSTSTPTPQVSPSGRSQSPAPGQSDTAAGGAARGQTNGGGSQGSSGGTSTTGGAAGGGSSSSGGEQGGSAGGSAAGSTSHGGTTSGSGSPNGGGDSGGGGGDPGGEDPGGGGGDPGGGENQGTTSGQTQEGPVLGGYGVYVQPRTDTVDCSQPITFTFSAAAQRPGTIKYAWHPDDRLIARGYGSKSGSMTFTTTNEQHDTYVVQLQNTQSGERVQGHMSVEVTSPEADRGVVGDSFDLTCA